MEFPLKSALKELSLSVVHEIKEVSSVHVIRDQYEIIGSKTNKYPETQGKWNLLVVKGNMNVNFPT